MMELMRVRAVHSWDYRRYLISSILALERTTETERTKALPNPTTASELAYTTRKISANFSNFSAWHYRTKLLPKLWEDQGWGEESEERAMRADEGVFVSRFAARLVNTRANNLLAVDRV